MSGCYVVFHKQLGDLLLLEPALSRLRAHHGLPICVLARNGHAPLLELIPGLRFQHGLALTPRSHLYCYDHQNKSALRALLIPARKKRVILPESREIAWFHRPLFGDLIVTELRDRYVAEYFWANTPVPTAEPFRPPRLKPPPDAWTPPGFDPAPYVLLNATSGWRHKSWLPERWAEVLRALHAEHGLHFVLTSASTDWQIRHCQDIQKLTGPYVRSLASGTSLENFLWLTAHARMVLTVDGAASHLAAAFGVRNLTLFGRTNIHNWHHPTPTSIALQAPPSRDGICRLRDLPVPGVLAAARTLWTQGH